MNKAMTPMRIQLACMCAAYIGDDTLETINKCIEFAENYNFKWIGTEIDTEKTREDAYEFARHLNEVSLN